jgi:hypothetical protein
MNGNKTQQPPAKKAGANLTPSKNGASTQSETPTASKANNGYTPKYTAPAEPIALPAPKVEIDIPHSMDIVTMEDLVHRITGSPRLSCKLSETAANLSFAQQMRQYSTPVFPSR